MNSKILLIGPSSALVAIGIFFASVSINDVSTQTSDDTQNFEFNYSIPEISQEKTQAICNFLELACLNHARFYGNFDTETDQTFVNYEYKDISYKFDVTNDLIKYLIEEDGNSDWVNLE